jgi:Carbonic anhydrase
MPAPASCSWCATWPIWCRSPDSNYHSVSAAVEHAVKVLRVRNIVVLGHARCGDIQAFADNAPPGDFIAPAPMKGLRATLSPYVRTPSPQPSSPRGYGRRCPTDSERQNAMQQVRVGEAVMVGRRPEFLALRDFGIGIRFENMECLSTETRKSMLGLGRLHKLDHPADGHTLCPGPAPVLREHQMPCFPDPSLCHGKWRRIEVPRLPADLTRASIAG